MNRVDFNASIVFSFKDRDGFEYVFNRKNWLKHSKKHADLRNKDFYGRVAKAVRDTDVIYRDYAIKNAYCFYMFEYETSQEKRYTKVVVYVRSRGERKRTIMTAYRPDRISEEKYYKPCKRP